jgi:hypothetical protein
MLLTLFDIFINMSLLYNTDFLTCLNKPQRYLLNEHSRTKGIGSSTMAEC